MDHNVSPIVVVGYDARKSLEVARAAWTIHERAKFLLRPEIGCPASVDRAIWPEATAVSAETNPVNLWNSISAILKTSPFLAEPGTHDPVLIEVGVITSEESADYWQDTFFGYIRMEADAELGEGYQQFGFDVADRYLLSGLSNCQLPEKELNDIRVRWASRVNSFGLFELLPDAVSYAAVCDQLIPEHAPFAAFRVRRVVLK